MRGFVFPEPVSQQIEVVRLTATVIHTFINMLIEIVGNGLGVVQRVLVMAIDARQGEIDR